MQITIDTNKDSPEDIRKVVALLSSLTDKNYSRIRKSKNIFEDSFSSLEHGSPESQGEDSGNVFANLFRSSDSTSSSSSVSSSNDKAPPAEEEKAEEGIEVIPY